MRLKHDCQGPFGLSRLQQSHICWHLSPDLRSNRFPRDCPPGQKDSDKARFARDPATEVALIFRRSLIPGLRNRHRSGGLLGAAAGARGGIRASTVVVEEEGKCGWGGRGFIGWPASYELDQVWRPPAYQCGPSGTRNPGRLPAHCSGVTQHEGCD